jgi:hypothetical protein
LEFAGLVKLGVRSALHDKLTRAPLVAIAPPVPLTFGQSRRGSKMLVPLKMLAALALAGAALPFGYSALTAPKVKDSAPASSALPTEPDLVLRGALARAGLAGPELAVAGVNAGAVAGIINLARASTVVSENRIAPATAALGEARAAVEALEEAVRGGAAERLPELEAARQAASAAEAALTVLIDELFDAATQGQPPSVAVLLRQVEVNKRYKRLPLEFLVAARTEAEWASLKEALTHERVCTKLGEETNPAVMQRLANFRAEEAVAAARTRLEANRSAVEAAWNAAAVQTQ